MYALVDCNNFFVSCERVFNPKLRDRPVIVLSNNDGCAVARSNEAKKLGIGMGEPLFKIKDLVRKHNVHVLSSNYALYGNFSARIMHIIQSHAPQTEVYSVDEAFIDLHGVIDKQAFCIKLVQVIEQYTGIPVSIGIGATRTLAKAANHIAKTNTLPNRIFYLDDLNILHNIMVGDVWGIGRQLTKRLHAIGIYTAAELIKMQDTTIKQIFNVVMHRTVQELRGISCIKLQDQTVNKDQIMVSRSFGYRVTDLATMQEALATYASNACIKLRKQGLNASGLSVFLHTGLHGMNVYKNAKYLQLPGATNDTRTIIAAAKELLKILYRSGYLYQKVGIILLGLNKADNMQFDIFAHKNLAHSEKLMQAIDQINSTLGRNTLQFAAAGMDKEWQMQANKKTPNYVGDWLELPVASLKLTE